MTNWTARAKSEILETVGGGTDKTRETTLSSVSSVVNRGIYEKTEGVSSVSSVGGRAVSEKRDSQNITDPADWRELAAEYHAHHFACQTCIAAGRGSQHGLRCGTGAALWTSYQSTN